MAGKVQGRLDPAQITLFDGTGMALEDAAVARMAYLKARQMNLGQEIALNRPPRG